MTSCKKSGKLKKADVLALLNSHIKPDYDASSPASSVVSGPDTPSILASDRLTKAHARKLEGKTTKLMSKRKCLEDAVDAERALLHAGRPTAAASPAWSRNMEALQERIERLSAKEMSHMADLSTKLSLLEKVYMEKATNRKGKAVEAARKIHDEFRKHLEPYLDYPMKTDKSYAKNEEDSDEDVKMDEESLDGSDEDEVAEDAKTTLEKEFERATRHMNLDDYDPAEIPSDVEEAIVRSAAKRVMTGGFMPINTLNNHYHSHATATHGFSIGAEHNDDPFFNEEKPTTGKSKKDKKKEKKRKRESVTNEAAAEAADDEHETPKKKSKKTKSKKAKKLKSEDHDSGEDVEHEASPKEDSPKKAKKAKKSKKDRDTSDVWTVPRRYSTSVIPLPVIPAKALAHITQSASKKKTAPTGPPVPIAAPVAPNSGRRRSFGPFSSPKKRVFSSIRNSPPPVMGGVATPEPKQWILEGDTSRARAKSTTGKVTMTIGAHPPVRPPREASPAEAAGQKRRPGRPKGSKTENRKAVMAGSPPLVSTTPIPLPAYASRAHDEDLVRMVIPDALGRPVLASSPRRGSMTLEDRLQQDRAMYAEERARWFQLMGIPDPAARI